MTPRNPVDWPGPHDDCTHSGRHVHFVLRRIDTPSEEDLRDAGREAALGHAHPAWRAVARQAVRDLAATGQPFTADDVVARVGMPSDGNALGGLFGWAAREGIVVEYGRAKSTRAGRHASRITVWKGA